MRNAGFNRKRGCSVGSDLRLSSLGYSFADAAKNVTLSYTYNLAGQPMSATASNATYRNTSARVEAADGLNRYSAVGASSLTYDGRSNLSSTGLQSFGYDGLNRLTSTAGTTLVYDALDRLNQVTGTNVTRFLYEGQQIIAEYNGSGALQRRYIPGPGLDNPYVWFEGTETASSTARWLLGNAFGSIIAVGSTGAANTTLGINAYDEYGVGPTSNLGRFQYKGMAYIPELGLYHARARTYSQYLGRFMQPDPSGYSDGMNLYAFVHNAPIGARDVLGLYGENPDCIRGPNHNECPGMQVTSTPPSTDPASAPIHVDWPELSVPTLTGGGGGGGGKSTPQTKQQTRTPPQPCNRSRANNPNVSRNIGYVALVGGVGVGLFAVVNIVGFPEVEAAEGIGALLGGASALGDSSLVFLNYSVYGTTAGGIAGFAFTAPQCSGR